MMDIVERLRSDSKRNWQCDGWQQEAADEIESLRTELEAVKFQLEQYELSDISEMQRQLEERRLACNQALKERDELVEAAQNLIKVKGRYHTEQAYKMLEAALAKVGADKGEG